MWTSNAKTPDKKAVETMKWATYFQLSDAIRN